MCIFFNEIRREIIDITASLEIVVQKSEKYQIIMGMDPPSTTPFQNLWNTDWTTCKIELSARVKIPGKRRNLSLLKQSRSAFLLKTSQQLGCLPLLSGEYAESDEETETIYLKGSILNFRSGPTGVYSPQLEVGLRHAK